MSVKQKSKPGGGHGRLESGSGDAFARGEANGRSAREHVVEAQRMRILAATVHLASERGAQSVSVSDVIALSGVSRRTFYELFQSREGCVAGAIEHAIALAHARIRPAYESGDRWVDRVRGGLEELLRFFDEEPQLARLCVVESAHAGEPALALRWRVLDQLARVIDDGREGARRPPPPLAGECVVGGMLAVVHTRLLRPGSGSLTELLGPLMSMVAVVYAGTAAARRELVRGTADPPEPLRALPGRDLPGGVGLRLTYRTLLVLRVIAAQPGLSNSEVSSLAGVADQGQMSRLLMRLSALALVENTGAERGIGTANAWRLTPKGERVERAVGNESILVGG